MPTNERSKIYDMATRALSKTATRRNLLIGGGVLGAGAAAVVLADNISLDFLDKEPEIIEANTEWENKHRLGLEPSAVSREHWRIRYLPKDSAPLQPTDSPGVVLKNGDYVLSTGIAVRSYRQAEGGLTPMLVVDHRSDWGKDYRVLNNPAGIVDTSAVVFENVQNGKQRFFSFKEAPSDKQGSILFTMRELNTTPVNNPQT